MDKKSIFVVGRHRSGTTWLANLLCEHKLIAGIQAERHFGIHESAFFSNVRYYFGNITDVNDYIAFVSSFSNSDYFKLSGIKKQYLLNNIYNDYFKFFKDFMDEFAKMNNSKYWVEKSPEHSLYIDEINNNYDNVKFVSIKRNIIDQVKSHLALRYPNGDYTLIELIKLVFNYNLYNNNIQEYSDDNIIRVEFKKLKNNTKEVMTEICDFLNISYNDNILDIRYERNTSFKKNNKRKSSKLSNVEERIISASNFIFSNLSARSLKKIKNLRNICSNLFNQKRKKYSKSSLPSWFYSILKEKIKESK